MTAYLFASGAALSWTLASLFGHGPARKLGSVHFNRLRMLAATILLCIMMVVTDASWALPPEFLLPILLSSIIGVVLGDYFLFVSMRRLGPRRTGILFAANAPIAACLGWLVLDETLSVSTIFAVLFGFIGICLAVIYGKRRDLLHVWEDITPPLWIGVGAGLLAAIGQAAGVLLLRPVMQADMDPLMVSLVRVAAGAVIFWLSLPFDPARKSMALMPDSTTGWMILANGFFGLSFGVALLLQALKTGNVADVTILSATSPVLILPFVWYRTGKCPPAAAWAGALLVVLSAVLLVEL